VAAFVAFACGGSGGGTTSKGTITIGSDLPTSGADASSGLPTQYGAAFAVSQAATVKGFTLSFAKQVLSGQMDTVIKTIARNTGLV